MNDTRYGYSEKAKTERKWIMISFAKKMKQIHRQLGKINDEFIYSK